MQLILYREDLLTVHVNRKCSLIDFEHFTSKAQKAILLVGEGKFIEDDHRNYNVVYPPKIESEKGPGR
jgi:hypothetical protein